MGEPKENNMTPQLEATLNAAVIRAVHLAAHIKTFSIFKEDALGKCAVADLAPGLPEGYQYRIETKVRRTSTYKPEDLEPGEPYAMVRAAKEFAGIAGLPEITGEPWEVYEFAALAESNARTAKECNAKRLAAAMREAGVDRWEVEGYGKATLCAGKPKARAGAVPVAVKETTYQYPELLTPYKREEAKAHAEESGEG